MKFKINDFPKVKLIIWDLDETFWKGTLSDHGTGAVVPITGNIEFVKRATRRGIIQSVCSKNDEGEALRELDRMGVRNFFVFPSISWDPKGARIQQIISDMALRAANVLFLDDNPSNLAEAEHDCPGIMIADPSIITMLAENVDFVGKDDTALSRLRQYQLMEQKAEKRKSFASNEDFLRESHICVHISTDVFPVADRVYELMQRSNQLNFTKKRLTMAEFQALLRDSSVEKGYVEVADDYGKYGIVGFYAVQENQLLHFFFSCRIIGMGIEQFVYAYLNAPELVIVWPVSGAVSKEQGMPDHIQQTDCITVAKASEKKAKTQYRILLKGPCDLQVMASYIEDTQDALVTEFNYVDENGNQADYFNHSVNMLAFQTKRAESLYAHYSFLSPSAGKTALFADAFDVVCLSPLMDATLAVYKSRKTQELFAYGLCQMPISKKKYWSAYMQKQVMTARSKFTEEELAEFADEFEQIHFSPEDIDQNFQKIISEVRKINPNTLFVILTLPELPYEGHASDEFKGKDILHRQINAVMRQGVGRMNQVRLLDVNRFIQHPSDYFDNINHYSKLVYYRMAQEFLKILSEAGITPIHVKPKYTAWFQHIKRELYKKLLMK